MSGQDIPQTEINASLDPTKLVRLESLERAFAPEGYSLNGFFESLVREQGGAYEDDGRFVSWSEMERSAQNFEDMVYGHCADFIKASELNGQHPLTPGEAGRTDASLWLLDPANQAAPVSEKTYRLHLVLERMYWELRQALAERRAASGLRGHADSQAAEWIMNEIISPSPSEAFARLTALFERFKNALLSMTSWYGLYRFHLEKAPALRALAEAGYEQRRETLDLTFTQAARPGLPDRLPAASRPRQAGRVTLREAADLCQVSRSTVQKWEKGRAPEGWPGRADAVELRKFAARYRGQRATARVLTRAARPVLLPPDQLNQASKSAFDDDDES